MQLQRLDSYDIAITNPISPRLLQRLQTGLDRLDQLDHTGPSHKLITRTHSLHQNCAKTAPILHQPTPTLNLAYPPPLAHLLRLLARIQRALVASSVRHLHHRICHSSSLHTHGEYCCCIHFFRCLFSASSGILVAVEGPVGSGHFFISTSLPLSPESSS